MKQSHANPFFNLSYEAYLLCLSIQAGFENINEFLAVKLFIAAAENHGDVGNAVEHRFIGAQILNGQDDADFVEVR